MTVVLKAQLVALTQKSSRRAADFVRSLESPLSCSRVTNTGDVKNTVAILYIYIHSLMLFLSSL